MHARTRFGLAGEELAVDVFRRAGYEIVDRNYRCKAGEVDVVAKLRSTVVFCEVKTRVDDRYGIPSEAVDRGKQGRLRKVAAHWLTERKPGAVEIRFDVVSVIVRDGRPEVTHIPDAF